MGSVLVLLGYLAIGLMAANLIRQLRAPGPDFAEACDVRPEELEEIAQRNAAQLAITRGHGPDPSIDSHVAFPHDAPVEQPGKIYLIQGHKPSWLGYTCTHCWCDLDPFEGS